MSREGILKQLPPLHLGKIREDSKKSINQNFTVFCSFFFMFQLLSQNFSFAAAMGSTSFTEANY